MVAYVMTLRVNLLVFFLVSTTRDWLQKCLDKLGSYCIEWRVEVNAYKAKTMIFSKQKGTMGQPIRYGESYLENVDSFEYVGCKLKYNTAVSYLMADRASKARRVTHMSMKAITTNDKNISPRLSLNLFDKQIMPILNYGAAVWSVPRTYNLIYLHNQTGKNTRQLVSKLLMIFVVLRSRSFMRKDWAKSLGSLLINGKSW